MSAYVVSKEHIDALVSAGLKDSRFPLSWYHDEERHQLTAENADEVGAMLWAENIESVGFRYSPPGRVAIYGDDLGKDSDPITELPGTYQEVSPAEGIEPMSVPQWTTPYHFSARTHSPIEILKAISCYEYQSCEHDGWEGSEAKAFCDSLKDNMICDLPGYSEAPWGIS